MGASQVPGRVWKPQGGWRKPRETDDPDSATRRLQMGLGPQGPPGPQAGAPGGKDAVSQQALGAGVGARGSKAPPWCSALEETGGPVLTAILLC